MRSLVVLGVMFVGFIVAMVGGLLELVATVWIIRAKVLPYVMEVSLVGLMASVVFGLVSVGHTLAKIMSLSLEPVGLALETLKLDTDALEEELTKVEVGTIIILLLVAILEVLSYHSIKVGGLKLGNQQEVEVVQERD